MLKPNTSLGEPPLSQIAVQGRAQYIITPNNLCFPLLLGVSNQPQPQTLPMTRHDNILSARAKP